MRTPGTPVGCHWRPLKDWEPNRGLALNRVEKIIRKLILFNLVVTSKGAHFKYTLFQMDEFKLKKKNRS